MDLVEPARAYLAGYRDALQRHWSPMTTNPDLWRDELARVDADPDLVLAQFAAVDPAGRTVTLPDGSVVPRLPGIVRWMWDGEFCGAINLRWQPGTAELPPHVLGHIGYTVVPWKQRRGYATAALAGMLDVARAQRLPFVELTTQPENLASQKVITANGGLFVEEFVEPEQYGGAIGRLYRIDL